MKDMTIYPLPTDREFNRESLIEQSEKYRDMLDTYFPGNPLNELMGAYIAVYSGGQHPRDKREEECVRRAPRGLCHLVVVLDQLHGYE